MPSYWVTLDAMQAYNNGYPMLPGQRPDLLWNALRLAAAQGLDLTRHYSVWCPAPGQDACLEIRQDRAAPLLRAAGGGWRAAASC
jgi:hypothetical protein